jgi:hypothetical protein
MKIICLHLNENKDRLEHIISEHKRMGLEDNLQVSSFTKLPINNIIGDRLTELRTSHYNWVKKNVDKNVYGCVFSCLYNWIILISQALNSDEDSVLFIEDDITYNCDKKTFQHYIDNIPEDCDISLFNVGFSTGWENNGKSSWIKQSENKMYIKCESNFKLIGTCSMWMNKKGMRYWLDYVQNKICAADLPFVDMCNDIQKKHNVNIYLPNIKLISHNFNIESNIQ